MWIGDPQGVLEVIARTATVYVFLVVLLRIAGKREVGQLSILELVTLLVISDAVQNGMVGDNTTVAGGLAAAATLVGLDRAIGILRDRFGRFRKVIEGEPRLLVRNGQPLRRALERESITDDELQAAVRSHGLLRVDQVAIAVLETDGSISIIPMQGDEPPAEPTKVENATS